MEMGYDNRDGNGEFQTGFMIAQGTIRRGSRCSAAKAFIRPVRNRPNLHIALESHVTKVLLDENNRAYGVTFQRNGKVQSVRAKREVILSAGTLNSAQLLMLSGIGPRDHLTDMGIPVVKVRQTSIFIPCNNCHSFYLSSIYCSYLTRTHRFTILLHSITVHV